MEKDHLHACRACGREVSRRSLFCPQCGEPQGSRLAIWLVGLFGLLLVAMFVAFYCYCACLCR